MTEQPTTGETLSILVLMRRLSAFFGHLIISCVLGVAMSALLFLICFMALAPIVLIMLMDKIRTTAEAKGPVTDLASFFSYFQDAALQTFASFSGLLFLGFIVLAIIHQVKFRLLSERTETEIEENATFTSTAFFVAMSSYVALLVCYAQITPDAACYYSIDFSSDRLIHSRCGQVSTLSSIVFVLQSTANAIFFDLPNSLGLSLTSLQPEGGVWLLAVIYQTFVTTFALDALISFFQDVTRD